MSMADGGGSAAGQQVYLLNIKLNLNILDVRLRWLQSQIGGAGGGLTVNRWTQALTLRPPPAATGQDTRFHFLSRRTSCLESLKFNVDNLVVFCCDNFGQSDQ